MQQVHTEVVSDLMRSSFAEALSQEKLTPAATPRIEPLAMAPGADLKFAAVFEVMPEVSLSAVEGIPVERPSASVTDADIDAMLESMRWSQWGGAVASGRGTVALRDCTPSCANGHTVDYPVTVTLTHPVSCFGVRFYGDSLIVAETARGRQRLPSFIRNPC